MAEVARYLKKNSSDPVSEIAAATRPIKVIGVICAVLFLLLFLGTGGVAWLLFALLAGAAILVAQVLETSGSG